ncbi:MAG: enoyl-CoA hydratase-related protein, partial [Methylococcales bacterium]
VYFPFHNGGMSTEQCQLLLSVYRHVAGLPVKAIVLMGGEESWSNGIHLNHIEAADNSAHESWLNINAIDDLIYQIITTLDKVTIAALAGSAGAGGAILALAADKVFARDGVILNPHYKNMGDLYGSEYWTYLLPKRVGQDTAVALTENRLPISAKKAWRLGLIDKLLDKDQQIFCAQVRHLVNAEIAEHRILQDTLNNKAKTRCQDESLKALNLYRKFELTQMYANFYGNEAYHQARRNFVYKINADTQTPENIAIHRQLGKLPATQTEESSGRVAWQAFYHIGDILMDSQHKEVFLLADHLVCAVGKAECIKHSQALYQYVKQHFSAEEVLMSQAEFRHSHAHIKEHLDILAKLLEIDQKIAQSESIQLSIQEFMDKWAEHILQSDRQFGDYLKKHELALIS